MRLYAGDSSMSGPRQADSVLVWILLHEGALGHVSGSPLLCTASLPGEEEKQAGYASCGEISEGGCRDEMFADDVALFNNKTKQMGKNSLNSESLKVDLKIHKGKTKCMTNHAECEDILIDQVKIDTSNTSDKPHTLKTLEKKKSMPGSEQPGAGLGKTRKYSKTDFWALLHGIA